MNIPAKVARAFEHAKATRDFAHAPYSKFQVGAAVISQAGKTYSGCNVENASYGGTVCAERVAMLKGVSEGADWFTDVIVVTQGPAAATPCALCLQVMAEFCDSETQVWIADTKEIQTCYRFDELLPKPFGPRQLDAAAHAKPAKVAGAKAKPSKKSKK